MKLIFLFSLCLSLISCGKKSNKDERNLTLLPLNEPLICDHTYSEGNNYVMSASSVATLNFGKQIDNAHLTAVASASGEQTVRYLEDVLGVNVRQATNFNFLSDGCSTGGRDFFGELESANYQEMTGWSDSGTSTTLGSYFPSEQAKTDPGKHLILIHPQTGRYTLVHEMMHYLFYLEKDNSTNAIRRLSDDEVVAQVNQIQNNLKTAIAAEDLNSTVVSFLDVVKYTDEYTVRFPIEEVTIEKNLLIKYIGNGMNYVTGLSIANSLAYIFLNIEKASDMYDTNISVTDSLLALYLSEVGSHHPGLLAAKASIQARINELASVKAWAEQTQGRLESQLPGLAIEIEKMKIENKGCSHSEHFEKFIENRLDFNF